MRPARCGRSLRAVPLPTAAALSSRVIVRGALCLQQGIKTEVDYVNQVSTDGHRRLRFRRKVGVYRGLILGPSKLPASAPQFGQWVHAAPDDPAELMAASDAIKASLRSNGATKTTGD